MFSPIGFALFARPAPASEAEQARDGITNYLTMLDAMATHYDEKRAARESG